eukprot:1529102-Rhodomonas_salina.1
MEHRYNRNRGGSSGTLSLARMEMGRATGAWAAGTKRLSRTASVFPWVSVIPGPVVLSEDQIVE